MIRLKLSTSNYSLKKIKEFTSEKSDDCKDNPYSNQSEKSNWSASDQNIKIENLKSNKLY